MFAHIGPEALLVSLALLLALKNPEPLLDKYKIRYVLFPPGEPLTYVLQHDPKWKVLYSDKISVLLERMSDDSAGTAANFNGTWPSTEPWSPALTAAR